MRGKVKLADNIRTQRKEHRMTQEHLAEALGVTVGAVYKWESGKATPELSLIMEMAEIFEISMDALVGYSLRKNSGEELLEKIKKAKEAHNYGEGIALSERALLKYPNDFEFVMQAAHIRWFTYENDNLVRALELLEKACVLIDQNTDDSVSKASIERDIGVILWELGRADEAAAILKKNNGGGMNNQILGQLYATAFHKYDEAMRYISEDLADSFAGIFSDCISLVNIYINKEDFEKAKEVIDVGREFLDLFRVPKEEARTSFIDKLKLPLFFINAGISLAKDDEDAARKYVSELLELAEEFEKEPSYSLSTMRLYCSDKPSSRHDNLGDSLIEGLEKQCQSDDKRTDNNIISACPKALYTVNCSVTMPSDNNRDGRLLSTH